MRLARHFSRCRGCGRTTTRDFQTEGGNHVPVVPVPAHVFLFGRTDRTDFELETVYSAAAFGALTCACGHALRIWRPLRARTVPTVRCGAKCTSATGPNCDCSCGGRNHGAGHLS